MKRFKRDRERLNVPDPERTHIVVALKSANRLAVLYVTEVGGHLLMIDGAKKRMLRVHQALRWYRKQLAENWFTERVDNDSGSLILLGMAEGMLKRPLAFVCEKGGAE